MKTKNYTIIDHTADMGIEVTGPSKKDLLQNAAVAFCDLICDVDSIQPKKERKIEIYRKTDEELLQAFLSEILFLFETNEELYVKVDIVELTPKGLKAMVYGEKLDYNRHQIKTGIKAVTYHQLKVEQIGDEWKTRIIFDV